MFDEDRGPAIDFVQVFSPIHKVHLVAPRTLKTLETPSSAQPLEMKMLSELKAILESTKGSHVAFGPQFIGELDETCLNSPWNVVISKTTMAVGQK